MRDAVKAYLTTLVAQRLGVVQHGLSMRLPDERLAEYRAERDIITETLEVLDVRLSE